MKKCKACGHRQETGKFCGKCGGELATFQGKAVGINKRQFNWKIILVIMAAVLIVMGAFYSIQIIKSDHKTTVNKSDQNIEVSQETSEEKFVEITDSNGADENGLEEESATETDEDIAVDVDAEPVTTQIINKPFVPQTSETISSSYLTEETSKGTIYSKPSNVFDGNEKTAWSEGVKGSGIGEWMTVYGDGVSVVERITFLNGYNKSSNLYEWNDRIKVMRVAFSDESFEDIELDDVYMEYQTYVFDKPVNTEYITFTILEVYEGSKYADCCISEIAINE